MRLTRSLLCGVLLAGSLTGRAEAVPVDDLIDLGGAARAIVTLKERDNFSNEFRYEVKIKNNTPDPLPTGALVLVLDRIVDLAGKEALSRMEVVEKDGTTQEGKPYFSLPPSQGLELAPYSESDAVTVRLKNVDYTVVFTPTFRVLGPRPAAPSGALSDLIQLLIKKGVLTEEEWRSIHRRSKRGAPP
jgi:hypothetical protein